MTAVRVTLAGCDDSTYIDLEASDDEVTFLELLAVLSEERSSYGCCPVLTVRPSRASDSRDES